MVEFLSFVLLTNIATTAIISEISTELSLFCLFSPFIVQCTLKGKKIRLRNIGNVKI